MFVLLAALLLAAAGPVVGQNVLNQWGSLYPNQALRQTSGCSGRSLTLVYQADGNLVLYRSGSGAIWHTHTYNTAAGRAVLQGDGNFVVYTPGNSPVWHTHTHNQGSPAYRLVLQTDENLVLFDGTGRALWQSGTRCNAPAPVPTPPPTPPPTSGAYKGCFRDASDRALPVRVGMSSTTVERCRSACADRGQPFAGLQYGSECWCGSGYGKHGAAPESECSMPCQGNAGQRCGNAWRNSVYASGGGGGGPAPQPTPPSGCTVPSCSDGASTWANYGNCVGASGCGGLRQFSNFNADHADFATTGMSTCYEWFKGQLARCNTIQLIYHSTSHRQCTSGSCIHFLSTTPHLHLQRKSCGKIKHARDAIPEPPPGQECDCSKVTDVAYLSC